MTMANELQYVTEGFILVLTFVGENNQNLFPWRQEKVSGSLMKAICPSLCSPEGSVKSYMSGKTQHMPMNTVL